jgi:hypothetical protein
VLVDSGLSTTGVVDFRTAGTLDAPAEEVVTYLQDHSALPNFQGLTVFLVGFGETAPPQEPLLPGQRAHLVEIWSAIVKAGGAVCATAIDRPRTTGAPNDVPPVAIVPIPKVPSFTPGQTNVLLLPSDPLTGFQTDEAFLPSSAVFVDSAEVADVLVDLGVPAEQITSRGVGSQFRHGVLWSPPVWNVDWGRLAKPGVLGQSA